MFQKAHLRVYGLIWLIAFGGICWMLLQPVAVVNGCIFKRATGVPCPSCGSTRSVNALLHGHWDEIIRYNPLGIFTLVLVSVACIWSVADVVKGSQSLYVKGQTWLAAIKKPAVALPLLGLLLANWIWNIFKNL